MGDSVEVQELSDRNLEESSTTQTPAFAPARSHPILLKLYTSHFLSTWNSRTFEFAAILFLGTIRPGTLLYASLYALLRNSAAVLLSSAVGNYVDRSNRLSSVRTSILWQRLPVALSCLLFGILIWFPDVEFPVFVTCFSASTVLACLEKLAIIGNTVAVERDWVVIVSASLGAERRMLNARMRRIDLFCKLLAPVVISFVHSYSAGGAVLTVLALNMVSVFVEYIAIARVYHAIPGLAVKGSQSENGTASQMSRDAESQQSRLSRRKCQPTLEPWIEYLTSPVFFPSLSLCLLYFTVLATGVQFQTYLLSIGYSGLVVSLVRMVASGVELSATCLMPLLMKSIGNIRAGLWSINWQMACLVFGVGVFQHFQDSNPVLSGAGLTGGIILSRLGLWGIDLAVQDIVQGGTPESKRGEFSGTEMALQNMFELLSFASTVVFPKPNQFSIPVFISLGAVMTSAACFAGYVRKERGHLVHLSNCLKSERYQVLSSSASLDSSSEDGDENGQSEG